LKENMSTDQAIETEIQAKGLTAARVTPADIEDNIVSEHYFTAENGARGAALLTPQGADLRGAYGVSVPLPLNLLTFCVLVLRNGFTVTGESACASPENFDADVGRKIARQNAVQKIWPLMGYELRQRLHDIKHAQPPSTDEFVAPGSSLFSDPSQIKA
jgi:Phage protein (N4 Gp49/phage Sf6 gene 66) family